MQVCFHNFRLQFPDQASDSKSSLSAVSSSRWAVFLGMIRVVDICGHAQSAFY